MPKEQKNILQFLLASLITSYPDEEFPNYVHHLLEDQKLDIPDELRDDLKAILKSVDRLENLRSEYIDLFDRGQVANPLYETEYGRDRALVKGSELADIAGFYKAFGLDFTSNEAKKEMLDHVAVELEFYALLLIKTDHLTKADDTNGLTILQDARKKFLEDHLGRFVGAIAKRPGVASSAFFSKVFHWCTELVCNECEALGANPAPAKWVNDPRPHGDLSCGGEAGCMK